jgi:hypothetical protein
LAQPATLSVDRKEVAQLLQKDLAANPEKGKNKKVLT